MANDARLASPGDERRMTYLSWDESRASVLMSAMDVLQA
jgi:hypothetical protein